MHKTMMSSGFFREQPMGVNREYNIVEGVSVCTMGEAKGHGVHLDSEFIDTVVEQGQARGDLGIKARFGHPNMCNGALGTHVGTFRNFRRDGDKARADLHISDVADKSPKGEIGSYLLEMAEKEDAMFGTSIVFKTGKQYRRDKQGNKVQANFDRRGEYYTDETGHRLSEEEESELSDELFIECEKLLACDAVDEPAANEGLFSADAYGQGELAAKVTEFLDLHPQVVTLLQNSPDVVTTFLGRFGVNTDPETQNKEPIMATEENKEVEEVVTETTALETQETEPTPQPETKELSELQKTVAEFGAEVATEAFAAGGGYDEAKDIALKAAQDEIAQLKAAKATAPADPIALGEGEEKPKTDAWGRPRK